MWAIVEEHIGLAWFIVVLAAILFEIGIEGWNQLTNGAIWPIPD